MSTDTFSSLNPTRKIAKEENYKSMLRQTKLSLSNSPKNPLLPRPWTPPCRVKQPPPWPPRTKPLPGLVRRWPLIAKAMVACRAASWFLLCSVKAWSKDTSFSMLLCARFGLDAGFADEEEVDHHQAFCMFLFAQPVFRDEEEQITPYWF